MLGFLRAFLEEFGDAREVVNLFFEASGLADGRLERLDTRRSLGLGGGDGKELGSEECLGVLKGGCMALVLEVEAVFPLLVVVGSLETETVFPLLVDDVGGASEERLVVAMVGVAFECSCSLDDRVRVGVKLEE